MPTLADYKAPYPAPTADQKRYVIYLDKKEDEDYDYKVELIPGRVEMVDGANHHFIGGKIEQKTVEGWGYSYHVVQLGPMAGTRMRPLGDAAEKRPKFVAMGGADLIRYNSKLPIVVYVPKNAELRYRIWSATGGVEGIAAKEE
ncbi:Ecotin, putative [Angomonas deanei]|uniref:Ecotin, putative n=1 Tax=Angomonas deanei TaxID=59799 RepID=A0A7G2CUI2_9TRYP|nr:Ecotin, putative [Angomonas deanei]